jgi:hypothetical protein
LLGRRYIRRVTIGDLTEALASARAMARPMPPLPPVTTATRPLRSKGFVNVIRS